MPTRPNKRRPAINLGLDLRKCFHDRVRRSAVEAFALSQLFVSNGLLPSVQQNE